MVKIDAIKKMVKHKVLLKGETGTGKTHIALATSFLFSERGKSVIYVDPEWGCQKEILELVESGVIGQEHIENIELYVTPKWKTGQLMEKDGVYFGGFVDVFEKIRVGEVSADLIVIDSMNELMGVHKNYIEQKFIAQGYYTIGERKFEIKDPDTFTLPWNYYVKLYDELLKIVYVLLMRPGHILCTMHPIGNSEAKKKVEEDIHKKFDTIIETHVTTVENKKTWYGIVKKNRGKDVIARIGDVDKKVVEMFRKVIV